jgi:antagonist of KipI
MSFMVLEPGLHSLLVDQGRPRHRGLGVPIGGAADREAWALGNALIGNPPGSVALEVTLYGPRLRALKTVGAVVYGAPFRVEQNGRHVAPGVPFTLQKDDELSIAETMTQLRAYLCVTGGFESPLILDSRSSLVPIARKQCLACAGGKAMRRFIHDSPTHHDRRTLRILCCAGEQNSLGSADHWYVVQPLLDRTGIRLAGPAIRPGVGDIVSEPVAPGTVQVTPSGELLILGIDAQAIGGYPKAGHVISADLGRLAQLRPGACIRFQAVSLEEAEQTFDRHERLLREWLTRLGEGAPVPPA